MQILKSDAHWRGEFAMLVSESIKKLTVKCIVKMNMLQAFI